MSNRGKTDIPHETSPSHAVRNKMDTHTNTCCAGSNWQVLELTGEACEVNPFLESYKPGCKVPIACCATIYTDKETELEYLLVADQML
eukprot:8475710-Ditylum_brightwellii.AAC.1